MRVPLLRMFVFLYFCYSTKHSSDVLKKKIKDLTLPFTPALKTIEEEKNVTERFERWEDNDG